MKPTGLMLAALALVLAAPGVCRAQTARSFEQLQLLVKPGDKVDVTDSSGLTLKGRVQSLSTSSLRLMLEGSERDFSQNQVLEIRQRRKDSLKNGALIGLGFGAGFGAIGAALTCGSEGCDEFGGTAGFFAAAMGVYGGLGAALGVGIDALIPSKQTVFRNQGGGATRLHIQPFVDRSKRGVRLAFSF